MTTNKTQKFLSLVIFFTVAPLFASDSMSDAAKRVKLADMAQEYLTGTSQPSLAVNIDAAADMEGILPGELSALATYLGSYKWSQTSEERYLNGAWQVQFFGRIIAIKLGFIRGAFNSLTETYKTTPVAMLADVTDLDYDESKDYPYALVGSAGCFQTPSGPFHFAFAADKLTISGCVNGQPNSSTFSRTITYQQWRDVWIKDASKYCGVAVKDYCVIPQTIFKSDKTFRLGLIVDKGAPLSGGGGLAADSVELCKGTAENAVCARNVDSPPLNLTFTLAPQGTYLAWDIYSNTKDKLSMGKQIWETMPGDLFKNVVLSPAFPAR